MPDLCGQMHTAHVLMYQSMEAYRRCSLCPCPTYRQPGQGTSAKSYNKLVGKPSPKALRETQCKPRPAVSWAPPLKVGMGAAL